MRSLSTSEIVYIWETGQNQHWVDRALTMLSIAYPDQLVSDLALLSVGQRDAYLLTLRELTFGSKLNGFAECPKCGEKLEFDLNVSDIRLHDLTQPMPLNYTLETDGFQLQFRLPNNQDLAAIAGCQTVEVATTMLTQRCVLKCDRNNQPISSDQLPAIVLSQLSEQMLEYDPQAEIQLALSCPACGHAWSALFDIVDFFWTELSVQAKLLLQDVHLLARFYGWREVDILSMSEVRRQFYLGLIS
ncbi:MAG: phage baseplate protein [Phormidium tanganyikae FI6-MK23]|nr:phage baseplate protein [Phormidium tanganyikae FI6-MK23]